jgi:hypothetical protein
MKSQVLDWLLEPDDPGVRYLALRDLCGLSADNPELRAARQRAHLDGPIATILAHMEPEGYWSKPGPGYNPKYFSTVWSIIYLAQLGANVSEDERIRTACAYILDHALDKGGQFGANGRASETIDCLQGNLTWALLEIGCDDPRLEKALEWTARTVTGEGLAPMEDRKAELRYYAYKRGPNFICAANGNQPCAWGAVKVMLALSKVPESQKSPLVQKAIQQGIDFLFSVDPATASYPSPTTGKPNLSWWKFGFPVFYVTDVLQIVETLCRLGLGKDPRLAQAVELVRSKQDTQGHWALEYDLTGKTWINAGVKRQPNKWVTYRALRALKEV